MNVPILGYAKYWLSISQLTGNVHFFARVQVYVVSLKNNHPSLLGNEAEDRHLKRHLFHPSL